MLFYYANSGHKVGLERVRRGAALLNILESQGVETQLLVNDFRAGLAARDLGVKEYVTVETVQDIDAIADAGNSIIIDSPEDDHGRLVKYCADFKNVWRFEHDSSDRSVHGEILFKSDCLADDCVDSLIVDEIFFDQKIKEERVLFFLGDADYNKNILNNKTFFQEFDMELLLGSYFFVKYENDLEKLFTTLHEPEDYVYLVTKSSTIVTSSSQTAFEAKLSGAKVIYLNIDNETIYPVSLLEKHNIDIVNGFDIEALKMYLKQDYIKKENKIKLFDTQKITSAL
ncbi:hypothetical protein MNB_SV-5-988 [hydrothermal vent metagenome]|uniref:Uncharacterized protein n=1 Tax=hydrothermal vent metagenome TaxID=652676 RepID=A0A1W1EGA1_9ZZZZ